MLCVDVTAFAKKEPEIGCVFWATVWATETCDKETEALGGNGSAGVDHLHKEEIVTGSIPVSPI